MGTFIGHVLPSIIFSLIALWWNFNNTIKYVRANRDRNSKNKKASGNRAYRGATIMPCWFMPTTCTRTMPGESFFKILLLTIYNLVEIGTGIHPGTAADHHTVIEHENLHHVSMLSGFLLAAIVEVAIYYGVKLPKRTDYMFNLLAFFIQFLIMMVHLNNDTGVEYVCHMIWAVITTFNFVAACIETYAPHNYWAVQMRIFFFFAQGTWLMQIAFVVWPQTTNPLFIWLPGHGTFTWLTISLMYHFMAVAVVMTLQFLVVQAMMPCFERAYDRYQLDVDACEEKLMLSANGGINVQLKGGSEKEYSILLGEDEDEETNSNQFEL